jgi:hypothetical protein
MVKARPKLESAGIAVLYALPIANAFFISWHVDSFHHAHPVTSIPRAILLLVLLVWALAWFVIAAMERLSPRRRALAWIGLFTFIIWLLGRISAGIFSAYPTVVTSALLASHIGLGVAPIVLLALWWLRPAGLQQILDAIRTLVAVSGFGMLILLPKLGWQALRLDAREPTSFVNPSLAAAAPPQPRIVWILMDELSYEQTFEHPPSGLIFPHFDDFAQHSTTFSQLQPTGYRTEEVVPGLLLGQPVADVEHIYAKPFRYRRVNRGPWYSYDPLETIFGKARQLGWTTGLAGWYNPYCRFLKGALDRCSWEYSEPFPGLPVQLFYNRSTLANLRSLLAPHERMVPTVDSPRDHESHVVDYRGVMAQSESLLRDQRIRFVMLHVPVPHPPGIYDRNQHALVAGGNYIDNLVLADDTLGKLMKVIRSTPDASETSVIVSSDHSWRVDYWKNVFDWTPEETRVSGDRFDQRPVLMVHFPGGDNGQVIAQPLSAMVVHTILEAMLQGQVHSAGDIGGHLEKNK